jgi:hypothetical protein
MKIEVKNLRQNPFRDLSRYPLNTEKVDALVQSIKDTEFWDNLLARKGEDGTYELAYGVHRLKALNKAGIEEVDIPVRKLDDTIMIKIMAHENQVEWGTSSIIEQETVRAVVKAFGEGKIELPKVSGRHDGALRYAPSFVPVGKEATDSGRPESVYTAATLSKFLGGERAGWSDGKIKAILATLASVERGLVEQNDMAELSTYQAEMVARETRRVAKETGDESFARNVGKKLATGMRRGTGRPPGRGGVTKGQGQAITYHGAKREADRQIASRVGKQPKEMPNIERFAEQMCLKIGAAFPTEVIREKLDAIVKYREHLSASNRNALVRSLRHLADRATKYADKLEG